MDAKDLTAELSLLLNEMEGEQGDRHEIYLRIRQMAGSLRAMGMPVPDDIARLERTLEEEFAAEKE